jgi:hypothetical protein
LAVGSFLEEYNNRVDIITARTRPPALQCRTRSCVRARARARVPAPHADTHPRPRVWRIALRRAPPAPRAQLDEEADPVCFKADPKMSFAHPYPPTKLMFIPDKASALRVPRARAGQTSGGQGFPRARARAHARRAARAALRAYRPRQRRRTRSLRAHAARHCASAHCTRHAAHTR